MPRGAEFVPGEILVKFKPDSGAGAEAGAGGTGAAGALLRGAGALSSEQVPYTDLVLVRVPPGDLERAVGELRSSPLVEHAEPNYIRRADFSPNDTVYTAGDQWNLSSTPASGGIDMPDAWDAVSGTFPNNGGDPSVVVAIVDTGVAYENRGGYSQAPDLAGTAFMQGYDFVNNDPYADDDNGHGTHVCGTVAQTTNNAAACAGIAFNCTVMPVKVLDNAGSGTDAEVVAGIDFAADSGVEVINMSLGGPEPSTILKDACDYAFGKGVVVCAAAGNQNLAAVEYPAAYPSCIAVGATNKRTPPAKAYYSNYGSALDVVAPGGDDTNPVYQQTYNIIGQPSSGFGVVGLKGTSMATPHVSGTAALVCSAHPTWSANGVRGAIASTCYDLGPTGWDRTYGWGLIDARAAVALASEPSLPVPTIASITPAFATSGSTTHLVITGTDFSSPMKVVMERDGEAGLSATSVSVASPTRITCNFNLSGAQSGLWDLEVSNTGLESARVQGGFMVDPVNNRDWYLAEGSTDYGFQEYILLQNPQAVTATANIFFMTPDRAYDPWPVTIPPQSRVTVTVNDILPGVDVSARVTADQDIVVERSMYWGNKVEGTDSIGVQAPSYTWYLAEGSTNYGFRTFLLIQNPNATAAYVYVSYLTSSGRVEKAPLVLDAHSRYSINVADDLPSSDMSFEVVADQRVIAERSMYWDGMRGGHASIATNSPAQEWYLAEGSTDWGFDEYVLLGNPGNTTAHVRLTYMTPGGPVLRAPVSVPAGSRVTVNVNADLPGEDVSVKATADCGIVVERSMYWNNGTGKGGHCQIAVPQPRQQNLLAEGSTDWGFDEWVLIQNPNNTAANIGIEFMTSQGLIPDTGFSLPANSRVTIHVNDKVPYLDTSTRVYSNLGIIAERSMYWNNRGGGTVSTGLMK
jgi:serine protease